MKYLLTDGLIVNADSSGKGSIAIDGDKIAGIWYDGETNDLSAIGRTFADAEIIDLTGMTVMAGGIDAHVHFREPGMTEKADISTEAKAAMMGGITSFLDMPNTNPPTISNQRLQEKLAMAEGRSYCNYGFNFGATNSNFEDIRAILEEKRQFGGIKVFMGSSTGNMLVDNYSTLESIFSLPNTEILIHSEDENIIRNNLKEAIQKFGDNIPISLHSEIRSRNACIRSTAKALEMAIRLNTSLHVLHVSTKEEIEMIRAAKIHNNKITAETSANYLWFCDKDYKKLGNRLKCNPSIKTGADRDALRQAVADGIIDTIGSDHAPHLLSEKSRPYISCPSGIPSIQQSFSVLMTIAKENGIPIERISSIMSGKVAEIFGIEKRGGIRKGYYADIVVFAPDEEFVVGTDYNISSSASIDYKCGWTPYDGEKLQGAVKMVMVNGQIVVAGGKPTSQHPHGQALSFRNNC